MSEVSDMMQHYREVRLRLRYPPNAVPDTGINLRRARELAEVPVPLRQLEAPSADPIRSWSSAFATYQPFVSTGLTFSSTIEISAAEFGLTSEDLQQKCRKPAICFPRQVAIYIASKQARWSVSWIANRLDLDHTTVLHANKKIAFLIETNSDLKNRILNIEAAIEARYPSATTTDSQPHLEEESERNVPESGLSEVD